MYTPHSHLYLVLINLDTVLVWYTQRVVYLICFFIFVTSNTYDIWMRGDSLRKHTTTTGVSQIQTYNLQICSKCSIRCAIWVSGHFIGIWYIVTVKLIILLLTCFVISYCSCSSCCNLFWIFSCSRFPEVGCLDLNGCDAGSTTVTFGIDDMDGGWRPIKINMHSTSTSSSCGDFINNGIH